MRNNKLITHNGETRLLVELSEEYRINYSTLYDRIYRLGWSPKKALTTPVRTSKQKE